ncbi:MAG: hypothetical protein FD166_2933 [Bacteroidetes bacterium]|nr:MAG: hypothetical protein FD166_2933 [Bacteroidota bacterium]
MKKKTGIHAGLFFCCSFRFEQRPESYPPEVIHVEGMPRIFTHGYTLSLTSQYYIRLKTCLQVTKGHLHRVI